MAPEGRICWLSCGFWRGNCCSICGAVIKFIDLLDIYFTKALPLTNGGPLVLWNDRWKTIPSEGVLSIVHDGTIIVRKVQGIRLSMIVFLKIKLLIFINVVPVNGDVVISVQAGLFMKEAQCVHKLMYGGALSITTTFT